MKPIPDPELVDEDNPEWTEADFRRAEPFSHLPLAVQKKLLAGKHQIRADAQTPVAVPLSAQVVAQFRAEGAGWEARIEAVLREWLSEHGRNDLSK